MIQTLEGMETLGDVVAVVGAGHVDGMARQWVLKRSPEEAARLLRLLQMRAPEELSLHQLRYYIAYIILIEC